MTNNSTDLFCDCEDYEQCINYCSDEKYSSCSKRLKLRNDSANYKFKKTFAIYFLLVVSIVISAIMFFSANKI